MDTRVSILAKCTYCKQVPSVVQRSVSVRVFFIQCECFAQGPITTDQKSAVDGWNTLVGGLKSEANSDAKV